MCLQGCDDAIFGAIVLLVWALGMAELTNFCLHNHNHHTLTSNNYHVVTVMSSEENKTLHGNRIVKNQHFTKCF
jgi:hypothetical protein